MQTESIKKMNGARMKLKFLITNPPGNEFQASISIRGSNGSLGRLSRATNSTKQTSLAMGIKISRVAANFQQKCRKQCRLTIEFHHH